MQAKESNNAPANPSTRRWLSSRPSWMGRATSTQRTRNFSQYDLPQFYDYGHCSPDCRLHYGRWREVIASFGSLTSTEQERVLSISIMKAKFSSQSAVNSSHPLMQPTTTDDEEESTILRPRINLRRLIERVKGAKSTNNPVHHLDKMSRPFMRTGDHKGPEEIFFDKETKFHNDRMHWHHSFHNPQTAGYIWIDSGKNVSSRGLDETIFENTSCTHACDKHHYHHHHHHRRQW